MTQTLFTFLFVLGIASFINGQNNEHVDIEKLALDYMKAYSDWNYEKMSTFYHDSIHFIDPTAQVAFKQKFEHKGIENVKNSFKRIYGEAKPEFVVFKVNSHFISDNFAIINSTFESILPEEWFGDKANGKVFIALPVVTILKFAGDKIISHIDYADYNTYRQQIKLQMKKKLN